jgi:hypothetical protein
MRPGLLILATLWACLEPASAQLFEIAAPTFSRLVTDDGNYTVIGPAINGQISRSSLPQGLLYFSFTVIGGQQTLDSLQNDRRLDVNAVILGDKSEIISGLGITQPKWATNKDAWVAQFNQLGFFTFRTYMNTKSTRDIIAIQIRDDKNNIVRPVAYHLITYKATVNIVP